MSIRTYLQFKVHQFSSQIADLKKFAAEEAAKQTPDGKNNHLSPKSSCWASYKALKRDCSLHLTMLSIVKRSKDEVPAKAQAVSLFHEHQLWNHARKGYVAKNFYFKAFRRLQKINNQLTVNWAAEQPALALWIVERKAKLEAKRHAAAAN